MRSEDVRGVILDAPEVEVGRVERVRRAPEPECHAPDGVARVRVELCVRNRYEGVSIRFSLYGPDGSGVR